jgi:hypothetical protein
MKTPKCVTRFFNDQRMNLKKNTFRNYEFVLGNFQEQFGETELSSITPEDVLDFMKKLTDGNKQSIKNCFSPFFPPFSIS